MEEVKNNITEPFRAGLTSNALPEAGSNKIADSSQTGVSPRSVLSATSASLAREKNKVEWYVICATYRRERKGMEYLADKGITTFSPTITKTKEVNGVSKHVTVYSLPNLFFAQGTEKTLKQYVERNPKAAYLHFYCRYYNDLGVRRRQIITVPQIQMDSFMKICEAKDTDIRICNEVIRKFSKGERVRINGGPFQGIEGRVAHIYGQQRVGIIIDNILTAMTSFVPTAYLERLDDEGESQI